RLASVAGNDGPRTGGRRSGAMEMVALNDVGAGRDYVRRMMYEWAGAGHPKKNGQALKAPAPSQRQVGGGQPIVTGMNGLASSRRTSNAAVLPAFVTSSLSCSGLFTGVRLKATITSPGRTPALAAAPPTCSTTTPSTTSPVLLSSGESGR